MGLVSNDQMSRNVKIPELIEIKGLWKKYIFAIW